MSTLKAELLAKSYKGREVVKNVGLEVEAGSIVGLLGPNGAGKTTTFYMIVGLVPSDKGKISIDDKDITLLPMHSRARLGIGYLPQESSIFRKLTVYQNLMAILETRKELNKQQREDTLNNLLDEFRATLVLCLMNKTTTAFLCFMVMRHVKPRSRSHYSLDVRDEKLSSGG